MPNRGEQTSTAPGPRAARVGGCAAATPRSASRSAARQGRCWPRKGRRKREGAGKRGARAAAAASGQGSLWRVCVRWLQPSAPRRPRTALKPNGVRPYASGSWPRRTDAPAWTGQTPRQADSAEFGAGDGGLQGRDIGGASLCSTTGSSCTAAQRLTVVCACARAQGVTRRSALTGLQMAHHPNPKGAKEVCGAPNPIKSPSHSAWVTPTMQAGQDSDG